MCIFFHFHFICTFIWLELLIPPQWKINHTVMFMLPTKSGQTKSNPLEDDLSWANMSKKKIVYTRNRITRNRFVILIYFLEIRITKFTRNWEKLLAGQEIIYSFVFVLKTGKLFLSLLNMVFAITEGNITLSF